MLKNPTLSKRFSWITLLFIIVLALAAVTSFLTIASAAPNQVNSDSISDTPNESDAPKTSHRLIVQLESPALAELSGAMKSAMTAENGRLQVESTAAQAYISQLEAEQQQVVNEMTSVLPDAAVSTYINEVGQSVAATYQVVFNGFAVDPGSTDREAARRALEALPGVKAVYLDFAHEPTLYASLPLINAPTIWAEAGGQANAGDGVKVASMDGGLHHAAAMFDGTGWSYPIGWPAGGLGDSTNNNGKIIASRAYFRTWDPPSVGDENTWPGTQGTSHGTHTGSTAVGNAVTANYLGVNENISGVAPGAWAMSYRVFYNSVTNDGSFYNAEGIAALEDLVIDGADVVNNSWGGGPGSVGGEFDPLDTALLNAYNAGVFVSMSAGNAGPGSGTGDHPSAEYINVAASTTSGTLASGRLNVVLPTPISPTLQNISYSSASFGPSLPVGTVISYTFVTAASINAANFEGCNPWPAGTFTGKAALISRGSCEFGVKVVNAENGGADFVVVYNHAIGGDELINMGAGAVGDQATIPSIFVGNTAGTGMVNWYDTYGAPSTLAVDTQAFQVGNVPDQIIGFSSRGPSAAMTLKPDIAAPGVNILAQGYAPGATGEARHLGYGQASGTSMASPHVAGSAAILRQLHPGWTNAEIKSAMMSTSKYMDIYNYDGSPAQPLDMGAGRLDLENASDPGVILDPPSLSFGLIDHNGTGMIAVEVTNITTATETYALSTLFTGNGFAITQTTTLTGFTVSPTSITLNAAETKSFTVTFDAATSQGVGDNQGYILLEGDNGHDAHMPAWARVLADPTGADVLIVDNDASFTVGRPNYISYYTEALDDLGLSYDVYNADMHYGGSQSLPDMAELAQYKAILYYTGDNYQPDGTFTVATPLTAIDMDILNEYANNGGIIIAMGQDLSGVLASDATDDGTFFYASTLGGNWLQDSVTGYALPTQPIGPFPDAPDAFQNIMLNLGGSEQESVTLTGANEVPPVATTTMGQADFAYNMVTRDLDYDITITVGDPITITAAHVHSGTVGVNGPVLYATFPFTGSQYITETLSWSGSVTLSGSEESLLMSNGLYFNVHSTANPGGEVRGQVTAAFNGDGAGNQSYIDEIETLPNLDPEGLSYEYPYQPLLQYPGPYNIEDGVVAMAHRDQPSLERPGISYNGRSIYTSFGLEGVNNGFLSTSREDLLGMFLDWSWDNPTATISHTGSVQTSKLTTFEATLTSNITGTTGTSYRWDFGDGSDYKGPFASAQAGHVYETCGMYTVRVEVTDSLGNRTIGMLETDVDACETHLVYLPTIQK